MADLADTPLLHALASRGVLRPAALLPVLPFGLVGTMLLAPATGMATDGVLAYAGAIAAWWLLLLGFIALASGAWAARATRWTAGRSVVALVGAVALAWVLLLPVCTRAGVGSAWLSFATWLPATILAIGAWLVVAEDRRQAAADRARFEQECDRLAAEARAYDEARQEIARLSDEADHAVGTALLRAQDGHGVVGSDRAALRRTLDEDVRGRARAISHAMHDVTPGTSPAPRPRLRLIAAWLDVVAVSGRWLAPLGYALVLAASLPPALLSKPQPIGALSEIGADAAGLAVTLLLGRAVRPRAASWPSAARRAAAPASFAAGLSLAVALAYPVGLATVSPAALIVTVLAAVPVWTVLAMAPALLSAAAHQRAVDRAQRQAALRRGRRQRDACAAAFSADRDSAVQRLHTEVQGRATAALVALDLAEAGLPGTESILAQSLARLRSPESGSPGAPDSDPLTEVLAAWHDVVDPAGLSTALSPTDRQRVSCVLEDALVNAVRHGRATRVRVDGHRTPEGLVVIVEDDGIGPPDTLAVGLGLGSIESVGGTWRLSPGSRLAATGATLHVVLPPGDGGGR